MSAKTIALVTVIGALSVGALLFSPPKTQEAYGQAVSSTEAVGVSITISGPGGGGGGVQNPAKITFSGFAYPNSVVTLLRNSVIIGTALTKPNGRFTKLTTVEPGFITFGIWARDNNDLISATTNLTMNIQANQTIKISNIFLSPTITADRFNLQQGGTLRIFGSAFPGSTVRVFNNLSSNSAPIDSVQTSVAGFWEYFFPTDTLGDGQYSIKVNAQTDSPHLVSAFSENLEFTIAEISCSGADFNFDTRVNIVDFSILIFYWQKNPTIGDVTNICTDLNVDEIVNIFDFSILMHQWTS